MALGGPGESYSDVILRLIETSAAHLAWSRNRADLSLACPHRHPCAASPYLRLGNADQSAPSLTNSEEGTLTNG